MSTQTFSLGMNAKAYFGATPAPWTRAGEADLAGMTELSNVTDVNLNVEASEADVTTRANDGWRAMAATLRSFTAEFQMNWEAGEEGFEAIRDAFLTGGQIRLAFLTGPYTTADNDGPIADCAITGFSREEPLEGPTKVSITAKGARWGDWVITS